MEPWSGLCCIGAVALYLLSRRTARDVDFLKSVTRVDQLKDLGIRFLSLSLTYVDGVGSQSNSLFLSRERGVAFDRGSIRNSWLGDTHQV